MILSLLAVFSSATTPGPALPQDRAAHSITERIWHLGDDATPEWPEAPAEPEGAKLELIFEGSAFEGEGVLLCQQRHVNGDWFLTINGQRIAVLDKREELGEHFYELPPGLIVDGPNRLELSGNAPGDDITFGALRYYPFSFRELHDLQVVTVHISDDGGMPLPARITILMAGGELVPVYYAQRASTAVREGVVYTSSGEARFELPPGNYTIHAARGTEWSAAHAELTVADVTQELALSLRRELDTTGFVAADTHIHTLTHSGHGDSSVEERMVTLAGEGVELAIATDHNHNTDYSPTQQALGLGAYFTPVVGNEVTTPIGHLNGFPLDPDDELPPYDLHDIVRIVEGIRARGAKAVILNHPRWPDHGSGPHGKHELDHHTGDWTGNWACPFDAIELINSETKELEPMLLFRDWFALLNRGERVFAVGSSDSHTVSGVVGQGRTYVRSATDDPSQIDIEAAAHDIANGHSSISMGIFIDARTAGRSVLGELLPLGPIDVRIAAPSWVRPRQVTIYANGLQVHERELQPQRHGEPFDLTFELQASLAWPQHDFWMVAVVQGDGVGVAWWPQLNNYTLAATNPVFFDVDGDGVFSAPRTLALQLIEREGSDPATLTRLLTQVDSSVAVQLLRLARLEYLRLAHERLASLADAAAELHPGLSEWLNAQDSNSRSRRAD